MDDQEKHGDACRKQVMEGLDMLFVREEFTPAMSSKGTTLLVFDEMPHLDVVWDDELMHEQQAAGFDECLVAGTKTTIDLVINGLLTLDSSMDTADKLFDDISLEVKWDEDMLSDTGTHESLLQHPSLSVDGGKTKHTAKHDAKAVLTPVSTLGLLNQYMNAAEQEVDDFASKVVSWDEELFHDLDSHDGLLQQLALGGECWHGEKMICIPPSLGTKRLDPFGDFESVEVHVTAQIDSIEAILTEVDNVKQEFSVTDSQVSACVCSEIGVLEIRGETINAGKVLTEMPCQEDTEQLVEQVSSGVAAVSEGPTHVLLNKISPNEMATTQLEQAVFMTAGVSDGDAAEVSIEFFGQVLWDGKPANIRMHHGFLQHFVQSGDYCGEKNKVESVDTLTSQGASHAMILAMPCRDVVWDDDLLGDHEYLEQTESKTAAMSRIYTNPNTQKMDGTSNCKKLQIYLDNSEVFAELHNIIVWASNMRSDMDTYVSLLQQLALDIDIEKGLGLFWMDDFSLRERARQHDMCLPTILKLEENLKSAVLVQIQNYALHPSLGLRKCAGLQNSMCSSFASACLFSLQRHYCELHHGEMQKPVAEIFLEAVLTDVSSSPLGVGSNKPQLACGKTHLHDDKNKLNAWLGDDKVFSLIVNSSRYLQADMVSANHGLDVVDFDRE